MSRILDDEEIQEMLDLCHKDEEKNDSFVFHNFRSWLKLNRHRFLLTPVVMEVKAEMFKVQFLETDFIISLIVSIEGEFSVWTSLLEGRRFLETWDWIVDFDIVEKKNENGFYSMLEFNSNLFAYYKTREKLYESLCYEPFLEWCNENLVPGKFIINAKSSKCGYSKICSHSELLDMDKDEIIDLVKINKVSS